MVCFLLYSKSLLELEIGFLNKWSRINLDKEFFVFMVYFVFLSGVV